MVSVILTAYNRTQWLRKAIESVLNQTYDDFELIIMEDNSPDPRVGEILDEYEECPHIMIYRSDVSEEDRYKTTRYATLINLGVREFSQGEYITYLTDDDYFYPHRLELMVDKIEELGVDIVYSTQDVVDEDENIRGKRVAKDVLDNAWDTVDHNSVLHTRKVFDEVGGWDDDPGCWGGADSYFWKKLTDAGYKFYPVSKESTEAKRYHTDSIQWKMSNGAFCESP